MSAMDFLSDTWDLPAGAACSWDSDALQLPTKCRCKYLHFWSAIFYIFILKETIYIESPQKLMIWINVSWIISNITFSFNISITTYNIKAMHIIYNLTRHFLLLFYYNTSNYYSIVSTSQILLIIISICMITSCSITSSTT